MREPTPTIPYYGMLAEFDDAERLLECVGEARKAGFERIDAYSPFPIDGLAEALGFHDQRVPWLTLAGGIFGAAFGYGIQLYTNLDYPIDVGGRPLIAPPAFGMATIVLALLFAVLFAVFGMLVLNGLPRLNHPVFGVEDFHLASSDKFFVVIFANDPQFDRQRTQAFLEGLEPLRVELVQHTEEPE